MKTTALVILAAALLGAATSRVSAQTNSAMPSKFFAHTNSVTAMVEDINYDKREITLKTADGPKRTFSVSQDVERFPAIKKGDQVRMTYYESVAISLAKPGANLAPTGEHTALISSDPGKKPGGTAVSVVDITATVQSVDREKHEVTLVGPEGNIAVVEVDPSVGNLEHIKKGDRLAISHTQALAISIEKP